MVKISTNIMNFLKNLFYTKDEVNTQLSNKANTSHSHSDDDVSVTTANYGEGINQNTFNGYLSYDMLTVKEKLNGIDEGANKTTVDSSLSSSSTNPVQNKVINSALSGKAASIHTHLGREIYPDFSVDSDAVSTAAYRKIFRITITKGYCDEPITFNLSQRREAMHSRIHITFKTASGKDPDLDSFYIEGIKSMPLYLYKEDASKWILLSKEVSNYDHVSINELLVTNRSRDYFTLTPLNELVTTLPTSDIYTATNTIDSSLSSTSTNPVQNKVINSALSGKASTSVATTSANGLMSSGDKTKLNGIATGATKVTVDSSLSSTSTNPVQNKVINTALAGKAASSHTHNDYNNKGTLSISGSGTVRLFKKNGWVIVYWENLYPSNVDTWYTHATLPFSNQTGQKIYAYFNSGTTKFRVRVNENSQLQSYNLSSATGTNQCYGCLMYPTAD